MGLLAWKNYAKRIEEKMELCKSQGIPYEASPEPSPEPSKQEIDNHEGSEDDSNNSDDSNHDNEDSDGGSEDSDDDSKSRSSHEDNDDDDDDDDSEEEDDEIRDRGNFDNQGLSKDEIRQHSYITNERRSHPGTQILPPEQLNKAQKIELVQAYVRGSKPKTINKFAPQSNGSLNAVS